MSQDTDAPANRAAYDAGPLPLDPPRSFAPLAAGDLQTGKSYLENSLIRMASVISSGEKFTIFEERAMDRALLDAAETLALLTKAVSDHRATSAAQES